MSVRIVLSSVLVALVATSVTLTGSGDVGVIGPWSVSQDCIPYAPGDTSGTVGIAKINAASTSTSVYATDNTISLVDTEAGTFRGSVVNTNVTGSNTDLDVDGALGFLVADRTVPPAWFTAGTPLLFGQVYDGTTAAGTALGTFASVYGVAVDPFDNSIFVSSYGSVTTNLLTVEKYLVIKYSSAGVYITQFGGSLVGPGYGFGDSGSANGFFAGPAGIAVSPVDGSVAVGDGTNYRVQIFTPNVGRTLYSYSTKVGTVGTGNSQFGTQQPIPLAYDSVGALYAADRGNARIQKFTISGTTVTYVSQVSTPGFDTTTPIYGLAFANSLLYASLVPANGYSATPVALAVSGVIRTFNTSLVSQNTTSIPAPVGTIGGIFNITADSTGVWANWGNSNYVVKYTLSGTTATEALRWYSGYPIAPELNTNYGLAVDTNGRVDVLFKSNIANPSSAGAYGLYKVTSFDWDAVTLSTAIYNYMLACDSTLGGFTYSYDATSNPTVVLPAWSGDVWTKIKELCTAYGVKIQVDGTVIRVKDFNADTLTIRNNGPITITPTNLFGGQQVNIVYLNATAGGGTMFDASTTGARYTIGVGQRFQVVVNTTNHLVSVDPLIPTDTLPILPGQYYLVDSTGAHVPAATWLTAGASVTPSVGTGIGQIVLTFQGPTGAITGYTGPFTFVDSNATNANATIMVTGTGTFTTPQTLPLLTGANPAKTSQQVAKTITNIGISTYTQAVDRGVWASDDAAGVAVTLRFKMSTADLLGFSATTGAVFSAFDSKYRITDIQWGALVSDITAIRHVTLGDVDTAWSGVTMGTYDTFWDTYSAGDQTVKPLARTH